MTHLHYAGNYKDLFDVLDAKDWFVNYNGLPKPEERMNDFDGVFGGSLIKNKTFFFFFSYEGQRLRQPVTQQTIGPDAASRQQASAWLNAVSLRSCFSCRNLSKATSGGITIGLAGV